MKEFVYVLVSKIPKGIGFFFIFYFYHKVLKSEHFKLGSEH